jgi:hypothetical protein
MSLNVLENILKQRLGKQKRDGRQSGPRAKDPKSNDLRRDRSQPADKK